ncbi:MULTISPECIES: glycosyltransferase family 2 protein [Bacillaceae]|uniref:Glycosyl transferase n=1 Tax=Alkalicoccobacillus plakortidis TaxID=444060 RepID=A0A9D5DMZ7_9BACI|nr:MULTISPECIES: glycosyltransferase family 2 protein [Bacillaceae]KQL57049.1 glycosyl transferase [Alkalicoccobacillus plakortidis]
MSTNKTILLSVLLVIRNEERYIATLMENLLKQEKNGFDFEIIVVDGRSTDRTLEIIQGFVEQGHRIRLFDNPKKTLPIGWNIGIKGASGSYILRIDGHTTVPRDFLQRYVNCIKRQPSADVVGGIIQSRGLGKQGKINEYVYSHPFGVGNSKFRTLEGKEWEGFVDTVPYGAYKRAVFTDVGLFDERLKRNEDIEFHKRMRDAGKTFFLSTSIQSTYFVRPTVKGLIDKSLGDGKWNIIANAATPGALGLRHRIPLLAFLAGLILLIASFLSTSALILFSIVVLVYAILNLTVSYPCAKENGMGAWLPCAATFFVLHFVRGYASFQAFFSRSYWRIRRTNT